MPSLHFTLFSFLASVTWLFGRYYILLFTSSLLPFNYLFCSYITNQERKILCLIFSYMFIWSFIISYTFLVSIFPFRKKNCSLFTFLLVLKCPWTFLFYLNSLYFSLYLFVTVVSKFTLHLANYLQVFGFLYLPSCKVSSLFLIHWADYFSETA